MYSGEAVQLRNWCGVHNVWQVQTNDYLSVRFLPSQRNKHIWCWWQEWNLRSCLLFHCKTKGKYVGDIGEDTPPNLMSVWEVHKSRSPVCWCVPVQNPHPGYVSHSIQSHYHPSALPIQFAPETSEARSRTFLSLRLCDNNWVAIKVSLQPRKLTASVIGSVNTIRYWLLWKRHTQKQLVKLDGNIRGDVTAEVTAVTVSVQKFSPDQMENFTTTRFFTATAFLHCAKSIYGLSTQRLWGGQPFCGSDKNWMSQHLLENMTPLSPTDWDKGRWTSHRSCPFTASGFRRTRVKNLVVCSRMLDAGKQHDGMVAVSCWIGLFSLLLGAGKMNNIWHLLFQLDTVHSEPAVCSSHRRLRFVQSESDLLRRWNICCWSCIFKRAAWAKLTYLPFWMPWAYEDLGLLLLEKKPFDQLRNVYQVSRALGMGIKMRWSQKNPFQLFWSSGSWWFNDSEKGQVVSRINGGDRLVSISQRE